MLGAFTTGDLFYSLAAENAADEAFDSLLDLLTTAKTEGKAATTSTINTNTLLVELIKEV